MPLIHRARLVPVVLFGALVFQFGAGYNRELALHIPLGVGILTVSVVFGLWTWSGAARRASEVPLPPLFQVPLPVPPVRRPVDGVIQITQRVADVEILPGMRTPVFGYDGIFPSPTLETRRGEPVVIRHHNELPLPTAVHLHGGPTLPEHDGWPLDLVLPSEDLRLPRALPVAAAVSPLVGRNERHLWRCSARTAGISEPAHRL
ncbi:MAG: multicopper oxidase domain-containing protein [Pseudonocardiaceae bacterium]